RIDGPEVTYRGDFARDVAPGAPGACATSAGSTTGAADAPQDKDNAKAKNAKADENEHTPRWLLNTANLVNRMVVNVADAVQVRRDIRNRLASHPLISLYLELGILLFVLSWLLKPNANSLHRLYRDRLSKAFLFDPRTARRAPLVVRNKPSLDQGRDFAPE